MRNIFNTHETILGVIIGLTTSIAVASMALILTII